MLLLKKVAKTQAPRITACRKRGYAMGSILLVILVNVWWCTWSWEWYKKPGGHRIPRRSPLQPKTNSNRSSIPQILNVIWDLNWKNLKCDLRLEGRSLMHWKKCIWATRNREGEARAVKRILNVIWDWKEEAWCIERSAFRATRNREGEARAVQRSLNVIWDWK